MQHNAEPEGTGQTETRTFNYQFSEPVENGEVPPQQQRAKIVLSKQVRGTGNLWSPF